MVMIMNWMGRTSRTTHTHSLTRAAHLGANPTVLYYAHTSIIQKPKCAANIMWADDIERLLNRTHIADREYIPATRVDYYRSNTIVQAYAFFHMRWEWARR